MLNPTKPSIFAQSSAQVVAILQSWGEPKFRGEQLCKWLFVDRVFQLEKMTNLPAKLKERLDAEFDWTLPQVDSFVEAEDGATKLLLAGSHNQFIETVILRYENRTSLCVSSQVGCKLACSFCQTGKLGFFRHLRAEEIVGQFCVANDIVKAEGRRISHIVFMGMGEPLDNFDNVATAVNLFTGVTAYGISPRKVTVSTSGIAKRIPDLAKQCKVSLAISLHASRDELRSELMPINRRYNLAELKLSLVDYQKTTGDLLTFEYILIKDKNCGRREAKELVHFLHGLRAKINLIPFNAHPGLEYERPSDEEIREFQSYLTARSFAAPVRYSKGLAASAACGQLAAKKADALFTVPQRKNAVQPAEAICPS
jgi:23S rRNA (adenine2503-C2)-methyltransferase